MRRAEELVAKATLDELDLAHSMFDAYFRVIRDCKQDGQKPPSFERASAMIRAGWIEAARVAAKEVAR